MKQVVRIAPGRRRLPLFESLETRRLFNGQVVTAASPPVNVVCYAAAPAASAPLVQASAGPAISRLVLVDANTNADIAPLANGSMIDLSSPLNKIAVRADTAAGTVVGSVQWALDGKVFRTENSQPFAVANDVGGKLLPWSVSPGPHTLTVTPFSGAGAAGTKGEAFSAAFSVIGPPSPNPGPSPAASISISDASTSEGNSGTKSLAFAVTRGGSTAAPSSLKWSTQVVTAGEGDFQIASGTLSFAAGESSKAILISIKGDTKVEGDETFFVNLASPSGATLADAQAQGTIVNDDSGASPTPAPTDPNDPSASVQRTPERHQEFLNRIKQGPIDLLFIGDSITDYWRTRGKSVFDANYSQYRPANFGVAADKTQNVIWRITHGELDGINPKVVVLQIGTNNTSSATPAKLAAGISKIVGIIRDKLPNAKILLLGMFPRGDVNDSHRPNITATNALIANLDDGGQHVKYLDIGKSFLRSDGSIASSVMDDGLHPTAKGYQIWADAMRSTLNSLLQ